MMRSIANRALYAIFRFVGGRRMACVSCAVCNQSLGHLMLANVPKCVKLRSGHAYNTTRKRCNIYVEMGEEAKNEILINRLAICHLNVSLSPGEGAERERG